MITVSNTTQWQDTVECATIKDFTELSAENQQKVCADCPFTVQCLQFALDWEKVHRPPSGNPNELVSWPVYGGMRVEDRMELLRQSR